MTKILLSVVGVLLVVAVIMAGLTINLYTKTVQLEQKLDIVVNSNKELEKASMLQKKSCDLTDEITTELKVENDALKNAVSDLLDRVNNIPTIVKRSQSVNNEILSCNADDDSLSPELAGLLTESYCSTTDVPSDCATTKPDDDLQSK